MNHSSLKNECSNGLLVKLTMFLSVTHSSLMNECSNGLLVKLTKFLSVTHSSLMNECSNGLLVKLTKLLSVNSAACEQLVPQQLGLLVALTCEAVACSVTVTQNRFMDFRIAANADVAATEEVQLVPCEQTVYVTTLGRNRKHLRCVLALRTVLRACARSPCTLRCRVTRPLPFHSPCC